ncbi:Dolichyl-phosphate-mannose--protein mannosyltransferase 2 [Dictyocoela muelleri]|nr:Dolichyl-phosphate-mannose--protein mannosyltransferase 2 [Dictyocoela muelleri]
MKIKISLTIILFLLTFIIRTYKIENGNFVIWDEAHFGKYSKFYLTRKFYFDVHPPFGKMMTAMSGFLFGQDPNFNFESATQYPENMDYVGMRRVHAFFGSFIPCLVFLTLMNLNYDSAVAFVFSFVFTVENGFISISRLILLDSHLLFFTSLTIYLLTAFYRNKSKTNLFLLGISLGCVMSIKWIGCLTTLLVGLYIIYELWTNLISKDTISNFIKMFIERSIFLILLPIGVYVLLFVLHFRIVNRSSSDEAHMSSVFQATLIGSPQARVNKYVEFGKIVSIKSSKMAGGNLHSHPHEYPNQGDPESDEYKENNGSEKETLSDKSNQKTEVDRHDDEKLKPNKDSNNSKVNGNQVTTYSHRDNNNHWAFQKVVDETIDVDFVHDKEDVVILHIPTKMYLGVTDENAFFDKEDSDEKLIVNTTKDLRQSNVFEIEIVNDEIKNEDKIKTLSTKFRLYNRVHDCYISSSDKNYPEWGFNQGVVVCKNSKDQSTLWNIEKNEYDPNNPINSEYTEIKTVKSKYLRNILEHNKAMYLTNKKFVQESHLEPLVIVSRPWEWFILRRGLRMCSWDDDKKKFYMFGNPFSWYLADLCVLISPIIMLSKTILYLRNDKSLSKLNDEYFQLFIFVGGWLIHYLPFFFVGRVLYFHHYYPALFFSMLSIVFVFRRHNVVLFIALISVVVFLYYSPLTYGFLDKNIVANKKRISTWDFI